MTKQDIDAITTGNDYGALKERDEHTLLNNHADDASPGSTKSLERTSSPPSVSDTANAAMNSKPARRLSLALGHAIVAAQTAATNAVSQIEAELRHRPIEDHLLTALSCFLVLCTVRWFTIGHSTPLISFSLLFQVVFFMAAATVIQGQTIWQQYSSSLVYCTVLHVIGLVSWPLVMAAFPVLITYTKRQLVETAKKVQ